jgi:hypothetical protein
VILGSTHTELKSYESFKEYFEAEVKQPFTKWHELEETYHYGTTYAPELLTTTYSEARKASQLHIIAASKEPDTGKVLSEGAPVGNRNAAKDKKPLDDSSSCLSQQSRAKENEISLDSQKKLDKLARYQPLLLDKVKNKELTLNKACVLSGYVKTETPLNLLKRAWGKASGEEQAAFRAFTGQEGGGRASPRRLRARRLGFNFRDLGLVFFGLRGHRDRSAGLEVCQPTGAPSTSNRDIRSDVMAMLVPSSCIGHCQLAIPRFNDLSLMRIDWRFGAPAGEHQCRAEDPDE